MGVCQPLTQTIEDSVSLAQCGTDIQNESPFHSLGVVLFPVLVCEECISMCLKSCLNFLLDHLSRLSIYLQ